MVLIANVVAFVLQLALTQFFRFPVNSCLALSIEGLRHGYLWQLLTYQFLHGGFIHLLLNCLVIYVFGRELEHTLGARKFLILYFAGGILGGLLQVGAGFAIGGRFAAHVVGASAGAFGLVAAFASLFPERPLTLLVLFVIPVTMRAKYLLLAEAVITLIGIAYPTDNIAHVAHLGGMIMGLAFVKYQDRWDWVLVGGRRASWPKVAGMRSARRPERDVEDLPPDEFVSKEVDPILDKISEHGIQSLTERERKILEAARAKMGRR
jgi:membrane associated rhomboid family serine protease